MRECFAMIRIYELYDVVDLARKKEEYEVRLTTEQEQRGSDAGNEQVTKSRKSEERV